MRTYRPVLCVVYRHVTEEHTSPLVGVSVTDARFRSVVAPGQRQGSGLGQVHKGFS